jgi:hypothetical protein
MRIILASSLCLGLAVPAAAQTVAVTAADYDRARGLQAKNRALVVDAIESPRWAGNTRLVYRKSVAGGNSFVLVDVTNREAPAKRAAFDHERLAAGLAAITGGRYTAITLPFNSFSFTNNDQSIQFTADSASFICSITGYTCSRAAAGTGAGRGGRGGGGREGGAGSAVADAGLPSPDGKRIAWINNHNVWVRDAGTTTSEGIALSRDGSEGNPYTRQSLNWAPNSRYLAAYRVRPGYQRMVRYVISSPPDRCSRSTSSASTPSRVTCSTCSSRALRRREPEQTNVDNALFPDRSTWAGSSGVTTARSRSSTTSAATSGIASSR